MSATPMTPKAIRNFHSDGLTLKAFGFVNRMMAPAISAVEKDLNRTICSGVTPVAMTIFDVLAFKPNRSAAANERNTPNNGFLAFTG